MTWKGKPKSLCCLALQRRGSLLSCLLGQGSLTVKALLLPCLLCLQHSVCASSCPVVYHSASVG